MKGHRQGGLSVASRRREENGSSVDLDRRSVKHKITTMLRAHDRWNAPQSLLSADVIGMIRHLDSSRCRVDTKPACIARPEVEDTVTSK